MKVLQEMKLPYDMKGSCLITPDLRYQSGVIIYKIEYGSTQISDSIYILSQTPLNSNGVSWKSWLAITMATVSYQAECNCKPNLTEPHGYQLRAYTHFMRGLDQLVWARA